MVYRVGSKIRFVEERRSYTVRATDGRFLICTKPFHLRKTVLYTIVDLMEQIRGIEGVVFGLGAETDTDCSEMLARISSGDTEISHRNRVKLNVRL